MFIFVREAIPMLVSTKGRYALRVMLELAQSDSTVYMPLPLIAEKQGISENIWRASSPFSPRPALWTVCGARAAATA